MPSPRSRVRWQSEPSRASLQEHLSGYANAMGAACPLMKSRCISGLAPHWHIRRWLAFWRSQRHQLIVATTAERERVVGVRDDRHDRWVIADGAVRPWLVETAHAGRFLCVRAFAVGEDDLARLAFRGLSQGRRYSGSRVVGPQRELGSRDRLRR